MLNFGLTLVLELQLGEDEGKGLGLVAWVRNSIRFKVKYRVCIWFW